MALRPASSATGGRHAISWPEPRGAAAVERIAAISSESRIEPASSALKIVSGSVTSHAFPSLSANPRALMFSHDNGLLRKLKLEVLAVRNDDA
jgi:hypothetical protein